MNGKVMHLYRNAPVGSNSTPDGPASDVKLPVGKNKETAAETTEKMKELLIDSLHIDPA